MSVLLDRLYNLHWVTPEIARSAQPYLGFYRAFLYPHGFRSLINLRGYNTHLRWWQQDKEVAESLHLKLIDVRLSSRLLPARETLIDLVNAFETAPHPILIKCSGGQDRTGLASALYILNRAGPGGVAADRTIGRFAPGGVAADRTIGRFAPGGVAADRTIGRFAPGALGDAQKQLALWPYLHWPRRWQGWLRQFPVFAAERAGQTAVFDWLRSSYNPQDFADWLAEHGLAGSYRALQTVTPGRDGR